MTTTKKVIIVAITVAIIGGLGYWAYKYYDKKSSEDDNNPNEIKPIDGSPVATGSTTNAPVKVTESTPSGNAMTQRDLVNTIDNTTRLTNADLNFIVRVFQNWMDKNHPNWVKMSNGTMGNLNGKSSLGYGNFGNQTKANLKKYKNDFAIFLNSITLFGIKGNRNAIRQFFDYASQFGI